MARSMFDSSDDDDFPEVGVLAHRIDFKPAVKTDDAEAQNKENAAPSEESKAESPTKAHKAPASLVNGTPMRRRKLGNSQGMNSLLFQKLGPIEPERRHGSPSKARTPYVARKFSPENSQEFSQDETSDTFASASIFAPKARAEPGRLPAKTPRSRMASGASKGSLTDSYSFSEDDVADVFSSIAVVPPKSVRVKKLRKFPMQFRERKERVDVSIEELDEDSTQQEILGEDSATGVDSRQAHSDEESSFVMGASQSIDSDSEDSDLGILKLPQSPSGRRWKSIKLPPVTKSSLEDVKPLGSPSRKPRLEQSGQQTPPAESEKDAAKSEKDAAKSTQGDKLEDAFKKLQIFAEDEDAPDKSRSKEEPTTPSKRKTMPATPFHGPNIPASPWKPEDKEFWDPEVQNKWIDDHSPRKQPSPRKLLFGDADEKALLKKKYGTSPEKRKEKKAFDEVKESLAEAFLRELDTRITSGKLGKLTSATGGVRIEWSTTLQSTAGRAHWKYKEVTTTSIIGQSVDQASKKSRQHHAFIELATKVLSNEDDLYNTVAHEFCHLAVFMLNDTAGTSKRKAAPHGAEFKGWGRKVMDEFGASHGIVVTTKHNYDIDYKYIWRCTECLTEVRRHSKSVDPARHRCGRCKGVLEQVKPIPRGGKSGDSKKSAYQQFVAKEMKILKAEGKGLSFGEMMGEVSRRWKAVQEERKRTEQKEKEEAQRASEDAANEIQAQLEKEFEALSVTELAAQ